MGLSISTNSQDDKINEEDVLVREKQKYGDFDQLFSQFDFDKNGGLTEHEFLDAVSYYKKMHANKTNELNDLLESIEFPEGLQISKEEFRNLMLIFVGNPSEREQLIEVFKCFDKNLNNEIGTDELKHVFGRLGMNLSDSDALEMIREGDTNADTKMDFEEFVKIMLSK